MATDDANPLTRLSIIDALRRVDAAGETYAKLLSVADGDVGMYRPDKVDPQQPHRRDEIYVVAAGTGTFVCGDERHTFAAGDLLFVPAGVEHRFVDFTDDFATWVVFFGASPA